MESISTPGGSRVWWMAVVVVTSGLAASLVGFSAPGQQPPPTFRAAVDLIAVDVQVADKDGRPVTNLGADKFNVTIDGHQRRVVSVDLVQQSSLTRPGQATSAARDVTSGPVATNQWPTSGPAGRTFMLAIDVDSFSIGESRGVAQAGRAFVDRLQPNDLVGLYTYPLGPRVDPTDDRAAVRRGLDAVVGARSSAPTQFNLSPSEVIDISGETAAIASRMTPTSTASATTTTTPVVLASDSSTLRSVQLRECEANDQQCVTRIEQEAFAMAFYFEGQATRSMTGLETLVRALGGYPGRKTVIVFSAGMPVSDRPGGRPNIGDMARTLGEEAARANATIYALHIDTTFSQTFAAEQRKGEKSMVSRERESFMVGRLLDQFSASSGGTMLRILVGSGEGALEQVLRETSAYYLLGVTPADADRDGRTHSLKVKVDQRGVTIRNRMWVVVPKKHA